MPARVHPRFIALLLCVLLASPLASAGPSLLPLGPDGSATGPVSDARSSAHASSSVLRIPLEGALEDTRDSVPLAPAQHPVPTAAAGNWTVLVYMVADNDLESFGIQDLNEMEAVPASSAVRVVVEVDRSEFYDDTNGDWTGTRRYLITHDGDTTTVTSTLLGDLGELNMGDPQKLADFLVWGTDAYPAQHYLVVLWDHGYGWSGGFGNDLGDNDHLSVAELSAALEIADAHLGRPIDLLGFDACLMQQVEVAYEFAWLADYLVAAEDLEPAAGWPYDEMVGPLVADPAMEPEALAVSLVESYMTYYGLLGEAMMSATSLARVRTTMADALNALALALSGVVEDPGSAAQGSVERAFLDARDQALSMFNPDYIDLGDFAGRLARDGRLSLTERQAAEAVWAAVNLSVIEESHSVYKGALTGISIYAPDASVPSRYASLLFAEEGLWDEFLVAALNGAPWSAAAPQVQVAGPLENAQVARRFTASLSGALPGATGLRLQFKAGWGTFEDIASGPDPLAAQARLGAGLDQGTAVLTFRALSASGVPSRAVERHVGVVAPPVTLAPIFGELTLAVNHTKSLQLNATPRAPFREFDVLWQDLPPGVSAAGSTGHVSLPPSPPPTFPITLVLTASDTAALESVPVALVVRSFTDPSLEAFLEFNLTLTRSLPDLALEPLALSNDLPWPGDNVTAFSNFSNIGFENITLARITAEFLDGFGNLTELANFTAGPMAPGEGFPLAVPFTATRGTQRLTFRVAAEPAVEELTPLNNLQFREITIVNLSVEVGPPATAVRVPLVGPTPSAAFTLYNRGTDTDTYDLSIANLTNGTWQAGLPFTSLLVAGRSATAIAVDVLPPLAAEGGDAVSFALLAVSQTDSSIRDEGTVGVLVDELFNASVRPQPNDLELDAGGRANTTVQLQNTGNGHESFAVIVQGADARLAALFNATTFVLGPGAAALAKLSLTDGGLVSTDRPYTLEVVAVSLTSGQRFSSIVSVRVKPSPEVGIVPLEPRVDTSASGNVSFHARVTNSGNTNLLIALSGPAAPGGASVNLSETGALLEPGDSTVVNGTVEFASAPLAGTYTIALRAQDTRSGANGTGQFEVVVPPVHDVRASVSPSSAAGPRSLTRTLSVENRGNTPETMTVVVGYVPVGITFDLSPSNETFDVPARSNFTLLLTIGGPAETGTSGEIQIILRAASTGSTVPVTVTYAFPAPAGNSILAWLLVGAAAGVGIAMWALVTRPRKPGGDSKERNGSD